MTRLVLEIPKQTDLMLLLALLERLNIRVVQRSEDNIPMAAQETDDKDFIMKGLPERENVEEFMREFEASRKDRTLPQREK